MLCMYVLLKKVSIRLPMRMHSPTVSSEAKQKAHHDGKDSSRENLELLMKLLTGRTSLLSVIDSSTATASKQIGPATEH